MSYALYYSTKGGYRTNQLPFQANCTPGLLATHHANIQRALMGWPCLASPRVIRYTMIDQ